jgi:hypothetical protein
VKAEPANRKLRIAAKVTIAMMASVILFIPAAGGPFALLFSAIALTVPFILLQRFIRGDGNSDFPRIAGALAFAIVVLGYILWFYIAQELDWPRVPAAIEAGTSPPPAQAGLAGVFIPIRAFFAGGAAYVIVALVSLAIQRLFTGDH